ncbi:MAG TPA: glycosyltransferase family 87 protein [Solirubrobacterales bacterium]|nr:glycosyltransferase family 87 protein [Solirubrobacterales bacterium]
MFVWVLTRAYMLAQIGLWDDVNGTEYGDVNTYEGWSNWISSMHLMPQEETWQYPPGAAFLFLIPRLGPLDYKLTFVILMLVVDLIGFLLITRLAKRERRDTGVWVWLLAMPTLGSMALLRSDLVATVIGIAALVVIHRRPTWFGALAGIGATIKVWPAFVLFGEWDRKRLLRSAIAAAAVVGVIFLVAWIAFGDQGGFVKNQNDRGLQIEAVGAAPWQLREVITGEPMPIALRFGTSEIDSAAGEAVATLLGVAAVLVLLAAAWWWWMRDRAIRRGREDLADEVLARDFVFTVVLLFLVTSRVLSPQFMIWMIGLAAVVLTAGATRLSRPAWMVIAAVLLSNALGESPGRAVLRDLALVGATIDASWTMFRTVR